MNKLIAYCGLDCEKCNARIATINDDNALRAETAKLWSEMNGVEITAEMIQCDGCRCDGAKTPYCERMCPIRKCAVEKSFNTCGECSKLHECPPLGMVISNNSEALENLKKQ